MAMFWNIFVFSTWGVTRRTEKRIDITKLLNKFQTICVYLKHPARNLERLLLGCNALGTIAIQHRSMHHLNVGMEETW